MLLDDNNLKYKIKSKIIFEYILFSNPVYPNWPEEGSEMQTF